MGEIWKDVVGYEGIYEISSYGRIRSVDRISPTKCNSYKRTYGKMLSPHPDTKGYLILQLCNGQRNAIQKPKKIHRLVAEAFIPNPEGKPQVNHKDLNKQNNHVDNLEWVTPSENVRHAIANGAKKPMYGKRPEYWRKKIHDAVITRCAKPVIQMDLEGNVMAKYESLNEAGRQVFGKEKTHIRDCCMGRRHTCGGFKWKYKEDVIGT